MEVSFCGFRDQSLRVRDLSRVDFPPPTLVELVWATGRYAANGSHLWEHVQNFLSIQASNLEGSILA